MASGRERIWLVIGASGQIGGALAAAPPAGVRILAPGRDALDLAGDIAALPEGHRISAIVNCAAYTKVDQAEDEPELAHRINAHAPARLAALARDAGIPIVQLSTDYVFAGDKPTPYVEDDATGPRSVYGRSKLAGEIAVSQSGAHHAVLRTAWVFSAGGANFVQTMLRLGQERDRIGVVADQRGTPSAASDIAQAAARVALALEDGAASGTWHVANAGEATWFELAEAVFAEAARHGRPAPELAPLTTADYPTKAARPANSRLATAKLRGDFGIALRPWREAVAEVVDDLAR